MLSRKYYPKTDVPMATTDHPVRFRTVRSTYLWAKEFLKAVAQRYGKDFVYQGLASWRWSMSTCFSGVGCAEIVQSLDVSNFKNHSLVIVECNVK